MPPSESMPGITASPGCTCSTAEPTAWIQPAFSWPMVYGIATLLFSAH
jgi:hypothetical protein